MLEKHCGLFVAATNTLAEAKWIAVQIERDGTDSQLSRGQIAALVNHGLGLLREAVILSDMDEIIPEIDRLTGSITRLLAIKEYKIDTVVHSIMHLISRIKDDLSSQYYFHMDMKDVPLFHNAEPFGAKVSAKFPKAIEDIEEASKCLALQRPTACVFHLMRAMEIVVKRLGKRLGVKNVEKEWGKILSDIDSAIRAMPDANEKEKRKKSRWSEARANLYHVKQAWRNETMHPKQTYTREQAHEVFAATRTFMSHLAGLL